MNFLKRTWAEIDLDALKSNLTGINNLSGGKRIIAMVKANAYGHDDEIISKELHRLGVGIFAVSNLWEAEDIRKFLPDAVIMIFGYVDPPHFDSVIKNDFTLVVGSVEYAKALSGFAVKSGKSIKIHIKIDTGMTRVGVDTENEISEMLSLARLSPLALCTHFPVSDSFDGGDRDYTLKQQEKLRTLAKKFGLPYHSQNSGGILYHSGFDGDFVRPGLILYGYSPCYGQPAPFELKPVMTLKSAVCQIKSVKKGTDISYGRTYTAPSDMRAAIIPIGYADGYSRAFSNKGKVLIGKTLCPVIGRVCMDQMVVDVSMLDNVSAGDIAEIYTAKNPELTIDSIARTLGTIPNEVVCALGHRVPRVAVQGGEVAGVTRYK